MAQVGYGPLQYIEGPLPSPPRYTLLNETRVPATPDDRWINGTSTWPYAAQSMGLWDPCELSGSSGGVKSPGAPGARSDQGSFAQWLAETCTMASIAADPVAYRERASRMFSAWEAFGVEQEFWHGTLIPDNPHLTDANAVLIAAPSTSPTNGLALLEKAIAATKQQGMIHCTPAMLVAWTAALGGVFREENGKLLSPNGNIVVPGFGYDGTGPGGATTASGTKEYAWATGPVEVRRSDIVMLPDDVAQALDRKQNSITYYAERYYNIVWNRNVQSAVFIDRCQTTC